MQIRGYELEHRLEICPAALTAKKVFSRVIDDQEAALQQVLPKGQHLLVVEREVARLDKERHRIFEECRLVDRDDVRRVEMRV